jgi:hypothetical protein
LWPDVFLGWFLLVGSLRISLVKVDMQIFVSRELSVPGLPRHFIFTDALAISRLCA